MIKGDTRSLDYGSYGPMRSHVMFLIVNPRHQTLKPLYLQVQGTE